MPNRHSKAITVNAKQRQENNACIRHASSSILPDKLRHTQALAVHEKCTKIFCFEGVKSNSYHRWLRKFTMSATAMQQLAAVPKWQCLNTLPTAAAVATEAASNAATATLAANAVHAHVSGFQWTCNNHVPKRFCFTPNTHHNGRKRLLPQPCDTFGGLLETQTSAVGNLTGKGCGIDIPPDAAHNCEGS